MKMGLYELLNIAAQQKTRKAKIEKLQEAVRIEPRIITYLKYACKHDIIFDLPTEKDGPAPYKPCVENMDLESVIFNDIRFMKYFILGNKLRQYKREKVFIEFLERIEPDDALFIVAMKDKMLPFGEKLTKEHVLLAFPEQTKGWRSPKEQLDFDATMRTDGRRK
jgi:hypothetical protein